MTTKRKVITYNPLLARLLSDVNKMPKRKPASMKTAANKFVNKLEKNRKEGIEKKKKRDALKLKKIKESYNKKKTSPKSSATKIKASATKSNSSEFSSKNNTNSSAKSNMSYGSNRSTRSM